MKFEDLMRAFVIAGVGAFPELPAGVAGAGAYCLASETDSDFTVTPFAFAIVLSSVTNDGIEALDGTEVFNTAKWDLSASTPK
jgi:hypothetical protein